MILFLLNNEKNSFFILLNISFNFYNVQFFYIKLDKALIYWKKKSITLVNSKHKTNRKPQTQGPNRVKSPSLMMMRSQKPQPQEKRAKEEKENMQQLRRWSQPKSGKGLLMLLKAANYSCGGISVVIACSTVLVLRKTRERLSFCLKKKIFGWG